MFDYYLYMIILFFYLFNKDYVKLFDLDSNIIH